MFRSLFVVSATCLVFCGCATLPVPGKLEVVKGDIRAQGTITAPAGLPEWGGALIRRMEIDLAKASPEFMDDIWVIAGTAGKTKLAAVTTGLLKEHGYGEVSVEPPRDGVAVRYRGEGISFDFDRGGKLVYLEADTGSDDDTSRENPRFGTSAQEGHDKRYPRVTSLALPCAVDEFESVFGKPDRVRFLKVN